MRKSLSILSLALGLAVCLRADGPSASVSPDDAWHMLAVGNERFARNLVLHPHVDAERVRILAHAEAPFAAVVSCSDSRVAPEIIFDQGLGDLFVLRNGGELVKDEVQVGSLEYAVEKLGVRLIVVLGHSHCDILGAALKGVKKDEHGSIDDLVADFRPAVEEAEDKVGGLSGDDLFREAVEMNVEQQMKAMLKLSPRIAKLVEDGKLKVVGGVYMLENNRVQWLGEHPSEKAVIEGKKP